MTRHAFFLLLADLVLALHVSVVAFIVGGLVLTIVGNVRGWKWVNRYDFRSTHLIAIAIVIAETWLAIACPLTSLEAWLRTQAEASTYAGSFIQHWTHRALYYDVPPWVFTLCYSLFGLAVAATWWRFPPRRRSRTNDP